MDRNTNVLEREEGMTLEELRRAIRGNVHVVGEQDYDSARRAWNLVVDQHPSVVVSVQSVADVQSAIRYARENKLPVGVQTTGHGLPRKCDGSVLIRMSRLDHVSIDREGRTATIGGGAIWSDVLGPASEQGLAALCGSSPGVGVVGYTLGGGFGLLLRKYGLAVDAVVSMEVVTADGEVRTVSPTENEDLFWALCGGGGGFCVVTEITIRLFPEATVFGGSVFYPAAMAAEIYSAFSRWARDLPNEVTSGITLLNLPPLPFIPEPLRGKAVICVTATVCGDEAQATELLKPIREVGTPIVDTFHSMPFHECGDIHRDPVDPLPALGQGWLLRDLPEEGLHALLEGVGPAHESPHLKIELRHLGGTLAGSCREAASIDCRRDAEFLLFVIGVPTPHSTPEQLEAHVKQIFDAMQPYILCRGPVTFLREGSVTQQAIREVFSDKHYARLRSVKEQYDAQNLFRFASLGLS